MNGSGGRAFLYVVFMLTVCRARDTAPASELSRQVTQALYE